MNVFPNESIFLSCHFYDDSFQANSCQKKKKFRASTEFRATFEDSDLGGLFGSGVDVKNKRYMLAQRPFWLASGYKEVKNTCHGCIHVMHVGLYLVAHLALWFASGWKEMLAQLACLAT